MRAASSLDHLVGEREQLVGHCESEPFGGLQVDDEVELRGLHNWQIARLFALQYSTGIASRQAVCIRDATAVGHEPTGKGKLPPFIDCWYCMARRKGNQLLASTIEKRITCDQERCRPPLDQRRECGINISLAAGI